MRYALVYKNPFQRTRSMAVEAGELSVATASLDPERVFVEHLIDFDNRTVTPVALTGDRRLIQIESGEYGEFTPTEYFEENGLAQTLTDLEESK